MPYIRNAPLARLTGEEGSEIPLLVVIPLTPDAAFLPMDPVQMFGDVGAQDADRERFEVGVYGCSRWWLGRGGRRVYGTVRVGSDSGCRYAGDLVLRVRSVRVVRCADRVPHSLSLLLSSQSDGVSVIRKERNTFVIPVGSVS